MGKCWAAILTLAAQLSTAQWRSLEGGLDIVYIKCVCMYAFNSVMTWAKHTKFGIHVPAVHTQHKLSSNVGCHTQRLVGLTLEICCSQLFFIFIPLKHLPCSTATQIVRNYLNLDFLPQQIMQFDWPHLHKALIRPCPAVAAVAGLANLLQLQPGSLKLKRNFPRCEKRATRSLNCDVDCATTTNNYGGRQSILMIF